MTEKEVNVDDSFFLVGHLFMASFSKNWASRLVRNIAPTRKLESFGPSLRGNLLDVFWTVCKLSDRFEYGDNFSASFIPAAMCLLKLFWRRKTLRFFFADVLRGNDVFYWVLRGAVFKASFLHLSLVSSSFSASLPRGFFSAGLFIYKMAKRKSCQNIRNPRVLSVAERDLYGWVDAEVSTQSSVISSDDFPELRREMRLTEDVASERDYMLEVAGPSDRFPLQALEDRNHILWVYVELFTCLDVRLPFTDFQREVLTRCRVAPSQLHHNGWGFLRTFEHVCLHFGFRASWRIFLYMYQLHAPPPGNGFLSFCTYQGRRLFDAFEESIQEFKWHYFKVLPFPGSRRFWLNDEGKPFPWVYWNPEAGECRITTLDPLETLAFQFLQSLPVGLGKKSNFKCRWIIDHSDAKFGAFLGIVSF
ncbi:hypothetical protein PIB30_046394 [Stylosanthes scabra]|uniref:Uncharacterized protein n=1 Tax=Stylosanthes scabra TaxID=79078 RepID=A0ABU6RGS0_9FABA|nr:hypothetical protein [Stylosanthes scabra]